MGRTNGCVFEAEQSILVNTGYVGSREGHWEQPSGLLKSTARLSLCPLDKGLFGGEINEDYLAGTGGTAF